MWGVSARREKFSLPVSGEARSGSQLKLAVEDLVSDWHPTLRQLVQMTAAYEIDMFSVKTSVPVAPWKALAAYERAMIDHGFDAVRATLRNTARFHAEGWIERTLTKGFFRVADLVPWLRNALLGGR
jgi:hypothetical protein